MFISLEDVVGSTTATKQFTPTQALQATTRVVVTPGSLAKQDLHTTRAGLFHLAAPQRAPSGPQHFVLYVSDSVMRQKWVLDKTAVDHVQLRKGIRRAVSACTKGSCCMKLRHFVKTSPGVGTRRMWGSRAQYDHCAAFQEYMTGLTQVVLGCNPQCDSMRRSRDQLEDFLEISIHRAEAVDRVIHSVHATPSPIAAEDPCRQDCTDANNDNSECPICCGDLGADETQRLPCGHNFHAGCVHVWLNLQHTCPVCRLQVHEGVISC